MPLVVEGKTAHVAPRKKLISRAEQKQKQEKKTSVPVSVPASVEQESTDTAILADQFATSLQQQIQMLRIENSYLKNQNDKQSQQFSHNVPPTTHILARGNEVSLNGRTWCQLPAHHPSIQTIISERSSHSNIRSRPTQEVDYRERRDYSVPCTRSSASRDMPISTFHVPNTELLHELEDAENKNFSLEKQLKMQQERENDQQKVIASLTTRIKEMENEKLTEHESTNNEKRALMEELLELQKRIDELTPVIAEKEMKISQVESEKLELTKRLRIANSDISNLQISISQFREEISVKNSKTKQYFDEIKFMEDKNLVLESEIREFKIKESEYQEKISYNMQQIREFELTKSNDKKLIDQLMEENSHLIKDNARLSTKLDTLEKREMTLKNREVHDSSIQNDTILELKSALQSEKSSVQSLTNKIEIYKLRIDDMEKTLQDRERNEDDHVTEKHRVDKELNALHALSKSLSSENKLLREEKLENEEIIDELRGKVRALEASIRSSHEIFTEKEKQSYAKINEMEEDAMRRHQKYLEFEELSKTLHQITSLLPSKTSSLTQDCLKK